MFSWFWIGYGGVQWFAEIHPRLMGQEDRCDICMDVLAQVHCQRPWTMTPREFATRGPGFSLWHLCREFCTFMVLNYGLVVCKFGQILLLPALCTCLQVRQVICPFINSNTLPVKLCKIPGSMPGNPGFCDGHNYSHFRHAFLWISPVSLLLWVCPIASPSSWLCVIFGSLSLFLAVLKWC